jgi:hypothetical protein
VTQRYVSVGRGGEIGRRKGLKIGSLRAQPPGPSHHKLGNKPTKRGVSRRIRNEPGGVSYTQSYTGAGARFSRRPVCWLDWLAGRRHATFEKAQSKVRHAEIYLGDLRGDNLPDVRVEAYWSALLNAGYSITEVLEAEVNRLRSHTRPSYTAVLADWHQTLTAEEADLFDALQEVRHIEVHAADPATSIVQKIQTQRKPRDVPEDATYRAIYASYLAMGMLSYEVSVDVRTYYFAVSPTNNRDAQVQAMVERFRRGGERAVLDAGDCYVRLLGSLAAHFVATYA